MDVKPDRAGTEPRLSWKPITKAVVGRKVLATNNLYARNAFGEMSHVWCVDVLEASDPVVTGPFTAFDDADRQIMNLTHYCEIPMPVGRASVSTQGHATGPMSPAQQSNSQSDTESSS